MKTNEALKLLGLSDGNLTPEDIKTAYRKAAFKYHPDRNPAGLEMMKMINSAYNAVKDFSGEFREENHTENFSDKINDALNALFGVDVTIEICGTWIWVTGNTKTHKELLKSSGYKWSHKKLMWYFRAEEHKSRWFKQSRSMDEIRIKYGSQSVKVSERKRLAT